MTRVRFAKGHGTGNDFILVSDPQGHLDLSPETVAAWCDRHRSIGADGLIRVVRSERVDEAASMLEADPAAEWFMDYRNADGSVAEMCGNGIRVFAEYLTTTGLAALPAGGALHIATRAGVKTVARTPNGYVVDMGRWREAPRRTVRTADSKERRVGTGIDVGNPHQVVRLDTEYRLKYLDLIEPPVLFPPPEDGSNVEFYVPVEGEPEDGAPRLRMRVFERGVGETMSCGTGVVATALAARAERLGNGETAPDHWLVDVPGGTLGVRVFSENGAAERVALSGPAQIVFTGEIDLPAA